MSDLRWAIEAAKEAGEIAMKYFKAGVEVVRKSDDSPVTVADREIELFLRRKISQEYPQHGILGEEFDEVHGDGNRWILDPIDGTKSFIYGVPLFSVLIGLERAGVPILGVAHFPALGETYWGSDAGAFCNDEPIAASAKNSMSDSLLLMGSLKQMDACGTLDAFVALARKAYATRNWGDAYGHCMVARGDAEAMFDPNVSIWDTCAVSAIVSAAGAKFTNFAGEPGHTFGEAISCAPGIFDDVVSEFRRKANHS
jgi:histidinol phosphatase-like enzyme (inositol monophosphatase family)